MRVFLACVLLCGIAAAQAGSPASPEAFDLKGDRVGAPLSEFKRRHGNETKIGYKTTWSGGVKEIREPNMSCADGGPGYGPMGLMTKKWPAGMTTCELYEFTLAEYRTDPALFEFFREKLFRITVRFPQFRFDDVLRAMTAKDGAPEMTVATLSNAMGGQFSSRVATWKRGGSTITLEERAYDINTSLLLVVSDDTVRAVEEAKPTSSDI